MLVKPRRNPAVVWREEPSGREKYAAGGEDAPCLTLVHLGTMHQLNCVGAEIWKLCDGTLSIREMAAKLLGQFDADISRLELDTGAFVDEMLRQGWLLEA